MRPLSQPLASDSQKEPDEQFPFPNFLAELQSRSIWPRSLLSLFFGDVSFWPSSHGQNLGQFLDECAWIFLILSVLTRSVVPSPHVVFSALFLPCLALSRRLASMPVLEAFFCCQASCQEMPSSGKRETENSLPSYCRKLLMLAPWFSLESLAIGFCLASSDQLVLISGYIMFLDDFPILAHMSRKSSILSFIHLSYTLNTTFYFF